MANTMEDLGLAVKIYEEKFGEKPYFAGPHFPLRSKLTHYLVSIDNALRTNKPINEFKHYPVGWEKNSRT